MMKVDIKNLIFRTSLIFALASSLPCIHLKALADPDGTDAERIVDFLKPGKWSLRTPSFDSSGGGIRESYSAERQTVSEYRAVLEWYIQRGEEGQWKEFGLKRAKAARVEFERIRNLPDDSIAVKTVPQLTANDLSGLEKFSKSPTTIKFSQLSVSQRNALANDLLKRGKITANVAEKLRTGEIDASLFVSAESVSKLTTALTVGSRVIEAGAEILGIAGFIIGAVEIPYRMYKAKRDGNSVSVAGVCASVDFVTASISMLPVCSTFGGTYTAVSTSMEKDPAFQNGVLGQHPAAHSPEAIYRHNRLVQGCEQMKAAHDPRYQGPCDTYGYDDSPNAGDTSNATIGK